MTSPIQCPHTLFLRNIGDLVFPQVQHHPSLDIGSSCRYCCLAQSPTNASNASLSSAVAQSYHSPTPCQTFLSMLRHNHPLGSFCQLTLYPPLPTATPHQAGIPSFAMGQWNTSSIPTATVIPHTNSFHNHPIRGASDASWNMTHLPPPAFQSQWPDASQQHVFNDLTSYPSTRHHENTTMELPAPGIPLRPSESIMSPPHAQPIATNCHEEQQTNHRYAPPVCAACGCYQNQPNGIPNVYQNEAHVQVVPPPGASQDPHQWQTSGQYPPMYVADNVTRATDPQEWNPLDNRSNLEVPHGPVPQHYGQ